MLLRNDSGPQKFECNETETLKGKEHGLALLQPIFVDALNRETNGLVASIVHALKVALREARTTPVDGGHVIESARTQRLFALLEGVLNYGSTYIPPAEGATPPSSEEQHAQRTKILESLTAMMTDRTGRRGDTIWSFGGAFRAVAGPRFGLRRKGTGFYGPASLPLGFHLTHLAESGPGFHLQVDPLDLGEYHAFNEEPEVETPHVTQALAPSLTVGMAFGTSIPFVLGIAAAYSPQVAIDDDHPTRKGTLSVGATAGFQVPLIDVN
jgi:hypothetical protein